MSLMRKSSEKQKLQNRVDDLIKAISYDCLVNLKDGITDFEVENRSIMKKVGYTEESSSKSSIRTDSDTETITDELGVSGQHKNANDFLRLQSTQSLGLVSPDEIQQINR